MVRNIGSILLVVRNDDDRGHIFRGGRADTGRSDGHVWSTRRAKGNYRSVTNHVSGRHASQPRRAYTYLCSSLALVELGVSLRLTLRLSISIKRFGMQIYWNQRSFSFFLLTIGFAIAIAAVNPPIVNTSWALLKLSLRTSNVFDGVTLLPNKSSP